MRRKVLGSGDDVIAVDVRPRPLQCFDCGHRHARNQVGILAISFIRAAPTRLASNIEIWSEYLMTASHSSFQSSSGEDLTDKVGVPATGQGQRLRKARSE